MTLLAAIAMLCCFAIPLLAVVAALSTRRTLEVQNAPTAKPRLSLPNQRTTDRITVHRLRSPLALHPRIDLAMGFVPARQSVDHTRRQHNRSANAARPIRLDRVYAREEMGDLSDPDIRPTTPLAPYSRRQRTGTATR